MLRLIAFVAIAVFSFTVFSAEPDKLLHQKCLYPSVVTNAPNHYGTGFITRSVKHGDKYRNVFITCAHNVPYNFPIYSVGVSQYRDWSEHESRSIYQCYYYGVDRTEDIAVGVFQSDKPMPVADLDFSPVYAGDRLVKIGRGFEENLRVDWGHIEEVNSVHGIRIACPIEHGDSGGADFRNYKVIGITHAMRTTGEKISHTGYAIPIKNLKKINSNLDISIDFAFNEEPLPMLPFFFMDFYNLQEEK